jgi:glycosyltransferase involved in cell wall biosynthesis
LDALDQNDITYVPMRRAPHASDLMAYSRIGEILKETTGRQILHAHSTKAGMIGALLHSQVTASVFTPHAYRGVDPNSSRLSKAFLRFVERAYSMNYDRIIAVAPAEMEYAKSIGMKDEVLRCVPNGLDTSNISFPEILKQREHLHEPLCLGFVGRLVYQKNPLLFIEVLAEVVRRGRNARAIIIGDGPMREEMDKLAERLDVADRIDWRGGIPAMASLPEMDVMVHTSVYEALPYTLIESCAALLPVVATHNYGSEAVLGPRLPDNITSGADANELVNSIMAIVDDESLRRDQLGILEVIAKEFSTDTMVDKIEAEYRALLQ